MMKSAPSAPFEMVQSELLLEFLIVALDAPSQFRHSDELPERRIGRQRGHEVLDRLGFALGPFDEQPLFRAQLGSPIVTMSTAHTRGGETRAQSLIRAFAPDNVLPLARGQCHGQRLDRDRLWVFVRVAQLLA